MDPQPNRTATQRGASTLGWLAALLVLGAVAVVVVIAVGRVGL